MDEVKIRDIRVKTVLTKSNLPIAAAHSRLLGKSLCRLHARLQVLLCLFHETFYGA